VIFIGGLLLYNSKGIEGMDGNVIVRNIGMVVLNL
jgi:hypothetical protein